jgi:tryptophanyl-tRNA synthetase
MRVPREVQLLILVPKAEEFFVQNTIESYDGLATILATRVQGGEVELITSTSATNVSRLQAILENLGHLGLRYQKCD